MTAPTPNGPPEHPETPDAGALVARIRLGDAAAFRALFERFFEPLHRYALRLLRSREDAEDVVHDVFLRLWRQRDRLEPARDVRAYLYAAARNGALDRLRRRRLEEGWSEGGAPPRASADGAATEAEVESAIESEETAEAIRRAVEALPPRQREIILLRWRRQMSYAEIAAELRIAEKTVGIHVGRALRRLRATLAWMLR
jgi:RNA polymerase sigma-70 factor (family 1)